MVGENEEMDVINVDKFIDFSRDEGTLDTLEKRKGVKKDLLRAKHYNLVLVCLESGQEIPSRPEPYNVCFYVLKGSGTFTIGEEKADLSQDEMVFVPANVPRGIESRERLVVLGIQEPN